MPDKPVPGEKDQPNGSRRGTPKGDRAFDIWLERGLHKLYDEVASEPIPEELLRLIEGGGSEPRGD